MLRDLLNSFKNALKETSPFIITGCAVLSIWVINLIIGSLSEFESRGTFGDMFGVSNSIFSGLAFIGVTYSVFMQREELSLTKKEAGRMKEVLEIQQVNASEQIKDQRLSTQEATFFKILDSRNEMVSQIKFGRSDLAAYGKDAFKRIFLSLNNDFEEVSEEVCSKRLNNFDIFFEKSFQNQSDSIEAYFRVTYTILKFVDNINHDSKYFLAKLFRAQISSSEANLLMCNYISRSTTKEFNDLIDKYGFLKNADNDIFLIRRIVDKVNPAALGRKKAAALAQESSS